MDSTNVARLKSANDMVKLNQEIFMLRDDATELEMKLERSEENRRKLIVELESGYELESNAQFVVNAERLAQTEDMLVTT